MSPTGKPCHSSYFLSTLSSGFGVYAISRRKVLPQKTKNDETQGRALDRLQIYVSNLKNIRSSPIHTLVDSGRGHLGVLWRTGESRFRSRHPADFSGGLRRLSLRRKAKG